MTTSNPQDVSNASQQNLNNRSFRIIHPFHPLKNKEFEIDAIVTLPSERRVFFYNHKGRKTSVPLDWTGLEPPDPFVVVSAGRSLFRIEDLFRLARFVSEIGTGTANEQV